MLLDNHSCKRKTISRFDLFKTRILRLSCKVLKFLLVSHTSSRKDITLWPLEFGAYTPVAIHSFVLLARVKTADIFGFLSWAVNSLLRPRPHPPCTEFFPTFDWACWIYFQPQNPSNFYAIRMQNYACIKNVRNSSVKIPVSVSMKNSRKSKR